MRSAEERRSLLFLRLLPGVGDLRLAKALKRHGSASRILELPSQVFSATLGHRAAESRSAGEEWREADRIFRRCDDGDIRIVTFGEPRYPDPLLALTDPPSVLFLRGDPDYLERRSVAIVGSRRATAGGRRTAQRVARELSESGVTVVSGLALGIDGAAHRGALEGRGSTVAVLGSGPDRAYPTGNRQTFEAIVEHGLVLSEFPPGESARPHHFPRRNRILAALSSAVVVVQAARRSGALITVDHALDLGLEVFAVPGSVERRQAEGTNALLRDGAHVLTRGRDLLEVMGWSRPDLPDTSDQMDAFAAGAPAPGSASDRVRVRSALERAPRPVDVLVVELGIPTPRVLAALTRLELEGAACREGGGWTRRSPS